MQSDTTARLCRNVVVFVVVFSLLLRTDSLLRPPTSDQCQETLGGWQRRGSASVQPAGRGTGSSGSPLLHGGGLVGRDGLSSVHAPTVAVHALKVGVAECGKGRRPPGGVEGQELLKGKWWSRRRKGHFPKTGCKIV